jgi:methylated-DNA-[protein]-cysteine S-methyltransferase
MPSEFAERVYAALRQVPRGRVTSYLALAEAVSCGSAQAIGQVLRRNPYAPEVPCHRVVDSQGNLHGFRGEKTGAAMDEKAALLEKEGVQIRSGKVEGFAKIFWADFQK